MPKSESRDHTFMVPNERARRAVGLEEAVADADKRFTEGQAQRLVAAEQAAKRAARDRLAAAAADLASDSVCVLASPQARATARFRLEKAVLARSRHHGLTEAEVDGVADILDGPIGWLELKRLIEVNDAIDRFEGRTPEENA